MKYYTGSAADFGALETIIKNNLTTDLGWTVNGDVVKKNGMFFRIWQEVKSGYNGLSIIMGDADNSGTLQPLSPFTGSNGGSIHNNAALEMSFPITYFMHAFTEEDDGADEIYIVINFNNDKYLHMGFGKVTIPEVIGLATGGWFSTSMTRSVTRTSSSDTYRSLRLNAGAGGASPYDLFSSSTSNIVAPFWTESTTTTASNINVSSNSQHKCLHIDIDGAKRIINGGAGLGVMSYLIEAAPMALNSGHLLIPIKALYYRTSSRMAIVNQHKFARWCRNDQIPAEGVISFGGEDWKVYPLFSRNVLSRATQAASSDSGTYAVAYRMP